MSGIRDRIAQSKAERRESRKAPVFAPAGQSTQMIVGATDASDATILKQSASLYAHQKLRRVYYSAFSPIPDASSKLPLIAPPLVREHRLYQADWLMRFYGFKAQELTTEPAPNLDLAVDPKLAWALRNRHLFPVDLNKAPRELLLRVPGLGTKSWRGSCALRRWHRLRLDDLPRLHVSVKKVLPFVITADYNSANLALDRDDLSRRYHDSGASARSLSDRSLRAHRAIVAQWNRSLSIRSSRIGNAPRERLWRAELSPDEVVWQELSADQPALDIFEETIAGSCVVSGPIFRVPKAFPTLARLVALHRDEQRWALALSPALAAHPRRAEAARNHGRSGCGARFRSAQIGPARHPQDARLRAFPGGATSRWEMVCRLVRAGASHRRA